MRKKCMCILFLQLVITVTSFLKLFSFSFALSISCSSFDYKLSWCCCLQLYSECIPKEEKIKISFWMLLLVFLTSYFVFLLLLMRLMILLFADDANGMKHRREWKIKKGKLKIVHSTFKNRKFYLFVVFFFSSIWKVSKIRKTSSSAK